MWARLNDVCIDSEPILSDNPIIKYPLLVELVIFYESGQIVEERDQVHLICFWNALCAWKFPCFLHKIIAVCCKPQGESSKSHLQYLPNSNTFSLFNPPHSSSIHIPNQSQCQALPFHFIYQASAALNIFPVPYRAPNHPRALLCP